MKSFFASIYKDICLFLSVSGIMSLLLPALVAAAFFLGMSDASDVEVAVEPFAVAVIDLDETMMSRTLLTQFREVDLLSEVRIYHTAQLGASADGKKQQIAFDENNVLIPSDGLFDDPRFLDCAAVITVPKDFFYDAYTGDEGPVHLVLNGRMPLESALTENMITSVMGILKSERAAWYSAYALKAGGEFDPADFAEFCSRSSDSIIASALTRRELLAASGTDEALAGNTKNTFFTCAASMLMLFVSAGVLKTLPDERRLGLADRFFSIGGKPISLILSKLTAAAVFCAAGLIPVILILRPDITALGACAIPVCFLACFYAMLALTRLAAGTEQFMLFAGLLTAASLLFGGTIYPAALMPGFARAIGCVTAPKYLLNSFGGGDILRRSIMPLVIIAAACRLVYIIALAVSSARGKSSRAGGGASV